MDRHEDAPRVHAVVRRAAPAPGGGHQRPDREGEAKVLELDPQSRARLAKRLLESLETLSDEENERVWVEEADRRDAEWDAAPSSGRPAADVLRDARARLK